MDSTCKGTTPLDIPLAPGRYEVRLNMPDYYDWEAQFEIGEDQPTPLNVRLVSINLFFTGGLAMKVDPILVSLLTVAVVVVGLLPGIGYGALRTGGQVPVFTLKDVNGKACPLSVMKNKAMTIPGRPGQPGWPFLTSLNPVAFPSGLVLQACSKTIWPGRWALSAGFWS